MAVGIDIGYGYTKSYCKYSEDIFPTAVVSCSPTGAGEAFEEVLPVIVNGNAFLVGDDAVRESRALISTRTVDFPGSDPWLAVLAVAMERQNNPGGTIVLGVPPGLYSKRVKERLREAVKNAKIEIGGKTIDLSERDIRIIPQGAGIFFDHVVKYRDDMGKNVAVIDIGYYTVDMVFFEKGKFAGFATKTIPLGVSFIIDELARLLQKELGYPANPRLARELFEKGEVTVLDKKITMADVNGLVAPIADEIARSVEDFLDNLPVSADVKIVAGGGVSVIKGNIRLKHRVFIVENPVMANARGYYWYGYSREKEE